MGKSTNFKDRFTQRNQLDKPQKPAIDTAIKEAVQETFGSFGVFTHVTKLHRMPIQANNSVTWTWLKISDPFDGEFVVLMPQKLQRELCFGINASEGGFIHERDLTDAQCELTNILAGRTLNILVNGTVSPVMTLPQTGMDIPDVRKSNWSYLPFGINGSWMVLFVRGSSMLNFGKLSDKSLFSRKSGFHCAVA